MPVGDDGLCYDVPIEFYQKCLTSLNVWAAATLDEFDSENANHGILGL